MVFRTHEARCFRNPCKELNVDSGRIAASSCVVVCIRFLTKLKRSRQMEILALTQCLLDLSMISRNILCFLRGLNRRDFGNQQFSSARCVNFKWRCVLQVFTCPFLEILQVLGPHGQPFGGY